MEDRVQSKVKDRLVEISAQDTLKKKHPPPKKNDLGGLLSSSELTTRKVAVPETALVAAQKWQRSVNT